MDTVIRTTRVATAPRISHDRPAWLTFAANAVALLAALVLLFTVPGNHSAMRVGDVAGETIVAQRHATYTDLAATAARRRRVMDAVPLVYRFTPAAADRRAQQATTFVDQVNAVLATSAPAPQKLSLILGLAPKDVSTAALQEFPVLSQSDFAQVRTRALSLLEQADVFRFSQADLEATQLGLLSTVPLQLTYAQRLAISDLLVTFMVPTLTENVAATNALRRRAAAQVQLVQGAISPGQVVVRRGDVVTSEVIARLRALGLQNRGTTWHDIAGSLLFATLILVMLFWYLRVFQPEVLVNPRLLLLMDACIVATLIGARVFTAGHVLLPFFLPVAAASTFAAVLMAPEACVALTLTIALLAGWVVANSFELSVYYFFTGTAGILAVRHVRQLKQFMFAGVLITLFALATVLAFGLVNSTYDLAALQQYSLAAMFNGFVSSALALGGFALLSSFFGVTTTLQLLELGQPNQPLLRRLMIRAPGTYNHSLIVSTMVERAADEVGANALAVKLAALYHDVGKTVNPHCFVENQLGMSNIHDELRPEESARLIRGHVPQGLRLARQHKLPRAVLDAIAEHHGTMTLVYFLHRARQEDGAAVDESLFIYPGPKPQSKETALLMLADGCESAVRASSDHSAQHIRDVVDYIFLERVQLGQLDECPLTLRDLEQAKHAFCSVLNGLYHPRVVYPEPAELAADPAAAVPREAGA
ncbi:MAG TPA: HDIG domain-containing protein [Chloroflexota bacterium]|nr:HDIG domain-containing protein [Chloroflexota bacterium]